MFPALFAHKRCFWLSVAVVLIADLASKHWAFRELAIDVDRYSSVEQFHAERGFPSRPLYGEQLRLVGMFNPGMMWGKFRDRTQALLLLRGLAVVIVLAFVISLERRERLAQLALGAVLGGALGNIHDSLRYAGVRDFLELDLGLPPFDPFPAFNLADSAICGGVAVLALGMLRGRRAERREPS